MIKSLMAGETWLPEAHLQTVRLPSTVLKENCTSHNAYVLYMNVNVIKTYFPSGKHCICFYKVPPKELTLVPLKSQNVLKYCCG